MLPTTLDLYFDGSCGPKNPGGTAGYAWRLVDPATKEVLASDCGEVCSGPEATNNVGEWGAVRNGLRYLREQSWTGELNIRGDSQLVIYQLIGRYKCRKETLLPYYDECMSLLNMWQWDAHWIPREENEECDLMSKKAYSHDVAGDVRTRTQNHGRANKATQGNKRSSRKAGVRGARAAFGEETPEVSLD